MKGPALWLKHYLRCRAVLSHSEWLTLLVLAAHHGEWQRLPFIAAHHGTRGRARCHTDVSRELDRMATAGLVEIHKPHPRHKEARITGKGMALAGWPELAAIQQGRSAIIANSLDPATGGP
jgi:predicted transcriptional regulator